MGESGKYGGRNKITPDYIFGKIVCLLFSIGPFMCHPHFRSQSGEIRQSCKGTFPNKSQHRDIRSISHFLTACFNFYPCTVPAVKEGTN